ncbi:MAG: hypothetical protein ACJ768_04670 [Gaiellaceae bacterium]
MNSHLIRTVTRASLASVLLLLFAPSASAKGPSQAVISGPGIEHPIAVRAPGASAIGLDLAALIDSSGIFAQLWCRGCKDVTAKRPVARLGPMYVVRYRMSSELTDGRASWVEQRAYPFAEPTPVTFVAPGQSYWGRRTVGGWYKATPRLERVLVGIAVPTDQSSPIPIDNGVGDVVTTPFWVTVGGIAAGVVVFVAAIVGLVVLGRSWRGRKRRPPQLNA